VNPSLNPDDKAVKIKSMPKVLRFKICQWYDKNKRVIIFGIDSVHENEKVYHVCDNNGMISFDTKEKAIAEIKKMNKEISKYATVD
jgi:delta-aminolevulinic acid dehydratase/porphobilinogen synthase